MNAAAPAPRMFRLFHVQFLRGAASEDAKFIIETIGPFDE
jgi:hypothetical protein